MSTDTPYDVLTSVTLTFTTPARLCTSCGAPHRRYTNLCASCDPTALPAVVRCVWPIRCYCPDHGGRGLPLIVYSTHRYAYTLPARLTEKVKS